MFYFSGVFVLLEEKLNDLEVILRLLPAPDIKDMAKSFRIQASGASNRKSGTHIN